MPSADDLADILASLPPDQRAAILEGPALQPPPGVQSMFDDPPNQNAMIQAVCTLYIVLTTVAVLLRAYCKLFVVRKVHPEDYFGLGGYMLFVTLCAVEIQLTTTIGVFVHQWDIRIKDLHLTLWSVNAGSIIYAASMGLMKVAILTDWIRTFAPRHTRGFFYVACQFTLWMNILFYSGTLIATNLVCRPYQRVWDKTIPGTCMKRTDLDLASAIINTVSHCLILILPHTVVWKLNMNWKTKMGISLVFAIGILTCIMAGFRLNSTIKYIRSADATYTVCEMGFWAVTELACVVLVFCFPAFPKAFRETRFLSKIGDSWRSWTTKRTKESSTSLAPFAHGADCQTLIHYRKMNEGIWNNPIPLQDSTPASKESLSSPGTVTYPMRIVRTTQFEAAEEFNMDTNQTSHPQNHKYIAAWIPAAQGGHM